MGTRPATAADGDRLVFTMPWPPTMNTYWRSTVVRGAPRVLLSERGREYRRVATLELIRQRVPRRGMAGSLAVSIDAYPPDRRARDLDNLLKPVLDCLVHANVIAGDELIDYLAIGRYTVGPGTLNVVVVRRMWSCG